MPGYEPACYGCGTFIYGSTGVFSRPLRETVYSFAGGTYWDHV